MYNSSDQYTLQQISDTLELKQDILVQVGHLFNDTARGNPESCAYDQNLATILDVTHFRWKEEKVWLYNAFNQLHDYV